jgi:hypothetical protein
MIMISIVFTRKTSQFVGLQPVKFVPASPRIRVVRGEERLAPVLDWLYPSWLTCRDKDGRADKSRHERGG